MNELTIEDKKNQIIDNEQSMADRLARKVIEKPVPPVWMVLIPIFFVFQVWRIKQYSRGLKDFSRNYLIPRFRALDTAFEAVQNGITVDIEKFIEISPTLSDEVLPSYRTWISILIEHYQNLLKAPGDSYQNLIRSQYKTKTSYLLFCNQLNNAEHDYNLALIPNIEGDQGELKAVLTRMKQGRKDHFQKEIISIFP